ncbi:MAG TPA: hypothetical protein VFD27_02720 [Chthoniobacteraceae bacterium]|nr:hypothetical protein [Chthoniobacteraceae bacterium]
MALLFCTATPFMNGLPRWTFLLGGFGYSAFLAFFVTGIFLLPQLAQTCVHAALFIGAFILGAMMLAAFHLGFPLTIFDGNTRPLLWALGTFLVGLFAFACYGWFHRFIHGTPKSYDRMKGGH